MNTICSALFVLAACLMAARADVNSLCPAATCPAGTFCRVVGDAASCLECVNAGTDESCNANGYMWALLANDEAGALAGVACSEDPLMACPEGASCVLGFCCYGAGEVAGEPVVNTEMHCPM